MTLLEWAIKHRIPADALQELCLTCLFVGEPEEDGVREGVLQQRIRLEGAEKGKYLFRNNRGAGRMDTGTYVRWGLANDSKKFGDAVKSADLIGWERIYVTVEMVLKAYADGFPGFPVARFLSVEVKAADWKWSGTAEECAQLKWATAVNHDGGRALITNRVGEL